MDAQQVLEIASEVYRDVRDRTDWPAGPWSDEAVDKVVWVDPITKLDCMAVRNHMGAWCGYVGIGPDHPWHGVSYGDCPLGDSCDRDEYEVFCEHRPDGLVDVHGGLTFANGCDEEGDREGAICHIAQPGRPDPVWWFGFDCGHAWDRVPYIESLTKLHVVDDASYKTLDFVVGEIQQVAAQLREVPERVG